MKLQNLFLNFKIGTKLGIGFTVIILLLIVTAMIGFTGLLNVRDRVDKRDDVNQIEKIMLNTRKQEKNFILRVDQSYLVEVENGIESLKTQALKTKEKFNQRVNKDQMDAVINASNSYINAFHDFVDLRISQSNSMALMRKDARIALTIIEEMRSDQKLKMSNEIKRKSGNITNRFANDDDANSLIKLFLEARKNEKEYIISSGDQQWLDTHTNLISQMYSLAANLKIRFIDVVNDKQVDDVVSAIEAYESSFSDFCNSMMQQKEAKDEMVSAAQEVEKECEDARIDQNAKMGRSISSAIILIIIFSILSIILGSFFAIIIARFVSLPIIKITRISKLLADGDLTPQVDINQKDEIGELADSFKVMQKSLRKQILEITEGVNVLFSSSSEIMATISQLASGSAETATSVSETTSTIEEVKQTAKVSNTKATEVAESAQKIALISQDGKKSVQETIEGMNKIKQQMESIAAIVVRLSEQGQSIGEIATSVNDLAEQSNLLAVNAAIEAAKAGEHGKGFAVVAQEIKNLAGRSKESTAQIRNILGDIQKAISSAVMATEQGGKVIDEGLELSSTATEVITTLAASVEQSAQANIQIAASSQQQVVGMEQITAAMESIKEASVQTAASTKQSEESVTELHKLGEKLQDILKQYKLK